MHATADESPPKGLTTWTMLWEVGEILRACPDNPIEHVVIVIWSSAFCIMLDMNGW